jgi:hypothetical protein
MTPKPASLLYTLVHIKSHQDDNTDFEKLSFPASLNVLADEQATRQQNIMEAPVETVVNIARVQLQLKDIAITRDSHFFGILDNSRQRSPSTENRVESYARKRKHHGRFIGVIRRSSAKEQQLDNSY